ncbi:MAG: hypothetical protein NC925_03565 [Candidatus Omnitrophica bacterium]|nr:hypothetical protein [Candidatus Omnitrophota bacterium]MCM8830919.1 hypothetical protein [Candidatus Omnitrophota bacterium]
MLNLSKLNSEFKDILEEITKIAMQLNMRAYLVGGVVRDIILNKTIFDLDIVIEGDAIKFAETFASKFKKEIKRHHSFCTATVNFQNKRVDFATARKEIYQKWGMLPKVYPATLKEDLFRRDFTINALAISLNKSDYGKLIDIYGGLDDLKKGLIRILHKDSFLEDPTRILRAIRFEQRFFFKIEKTTYKLLKEAIKINALTLVHPHRLRDEIILLFKEEKPNYCIRRILSLCGFSFIDKNIKLERDDFRLILRINNTVLFYQKYLKKHRRLNKWIIYLAVFVYKLKTAKLIKFIQRFGFRKGERIILLSIKKNFLKIRKLDKKLKPHIIYKLLNPLSFEAILFFYAYYKKERIRDNIKYFLKTLVNIRLNINGDDLKKIGIAPSSLYNKILTKLLYLKMDKKIHTKEEEYLILKKILSHKKRFEKYEN